MPRPFNRRQARENAAFLRILAETGNAELAARECGLHKPTLYSRRRVNAAFAAEWDAALTVAQARMASAPREAARAGKGRWPDSAKAPARFASGGARERDSRARDPEAPDLKTPNLKTRGGEPAITRMKDGRLQLRLVRAGGIGFRAEQAFLRALATCGNITMAARAVGVAPRNVLARRARNPLFKAEMDKARRLASDRLLLAANERARAALCGDGADDLWLEEDFAALPAMTIDQVLMLLRLHHRREALGDEWGRLGTRKRRGALSSNEIAIEREIWWHAEQERRRIEADKRERAARRGEEYERTGNWFLPGEEVADVLGPKAGRGNGRRA
jgi:hypothetical protein